MSVTLRTGWNLTGFRSGLEAMKSEARTFRDTFDRTLQSGGGLFGALDRALGKLAGGRLAAPIAALGAGMVAIRAVSGGIEKHWQNIAQSTARTLQNIEAIESTRANVAGVRYAGDAAQRDAERDLAAKRAALQTAQSQLAEFGNAPPTTNEGRAEFARAMSGTGLRGYFDYIRLTASQYIPGMDGPIDEASEEYNRRAAAVEKARQELLAAEAMNPFGAYNNRSEQRAGVSAQIAAEDRLGVAQGRTTAYEAAANALLMADQQYRDTQKTFGDDDPRTQQARAAVLNAATTYDNEIVNARRYRNDPLIAADSLTRLGGGGGVNVFGNGQGELLFEQKRMNQSMQGVLEILRRFEVRLSRSPGDVN